MKNKEAVWDHDNLPNISGHYWVQYFRGDGSPDGDAELQHMDLETETGWAENMPGGFAWTHVVNRHYPAKRYGRSSTKRMGRPTRRASFTPDEIEFVRKNRGMTALQISARLGCGRTMVQRTRRHIAEGSV